MAYKRDKNGESVAFPAATMAALLRTMKLTPNQLHTELARGMSNDNAAWLGLAKPFCNPSMFEPGAKSQVPTTSGKEESPMYYTLLAVNMAVALYDNAFTGALGSTGRCRQFNVNDLRGKPPVRCADVPIGTEGQGSIFVIRYACPRNLRQFAWPDGKFDPAKIEIPPPLVTEGLMWKDDAIQRYRELVEQERDHESVFLRSCLRILALPFEVMLDFILSRGRLVHVDSREKVISLPHFRLFIERKHSVGRGMVARYGLGTFIPHPDYVPGMNETAVQLADIFSLPNALRLFFRYVAPHGRLFDHENRMITKEIMFMARFYLRLDQLPSDHHLRQTNEKMTEIRNEVRDRERLRSTLEWIQTFPEDTKTQQAEIEAELQLRDQIVGTDVQLAEAFARLAAILDTEEKGCQAVAEGKTDGPDCVPKEWLRLAQAVSERIGDRSSFPDFSPFSTVYYLFDSGNFQLGDPARIARGPLVPDELESMADDRKVVDKEITAMFRASTATADQFADFQRKMIRMVYKSLGLLTNTHYEIKSPDCRKLYDRSAFFLLPAHGAHPFKIRVKHSHLSPKDDLLGVMSDILVAMGVVDARPEAVRWLELYLEAPSSRRDVRTIIAMGGTGAGKTWFLNFLARIAGDPEGTVGTSETAMAAFYALARHFYPELIDEISRFGDREQKGDNTLVKAVVLFASHGAVTTVTTNSALSSGLKANSGQKRSRKVVAQKDKDINGEYRIKELKTEVSTTPMASMNGNLLTLEKALRARLIAIPFVSQTQSRSDGYFRAVWAPDTSRQIQYLHETVHVMYIAWHLFHSGFRCPELFSFHGMAAAIWDQMTSAEHKSTTEQEFLRLNKTEKNRSSFVTAAYAQFQTNLEQAKATKFPIDVYRSRHQFHVLEQKVKQFATQISQGVELEGLREGDGTDLCSSRSDDNVRYASQNSSVLSSVRTLFEFNAGCMSYGCSDVGWAYSRMFLPWVDHLSFLRGIEQSLEPLDPRTLFAALSVVALVIDWINLRPEKVVFDIKSGYLALKGFFSAQTMESAQAAAAGVTEDNANTVVRNFAMFDTADAKVEAETKQPPASPREVYNIRSRVSVYNMLCAKSFPTRLWTPQDIIEYRAFLSQIGSNDSPEGTPFVHYAPFYTPTCTQDLLIHCRIFGLFDFMRRKISHSLSELERPEACLLTSSTSVAVEDPCPEFDEYETRNQVIRRELDVMWLKSRRFDRNVLNPKSVYHREDYRTLFGLYSFKRAELLHRRQVIGVQTEPLPDDFFDERAEELKYEQELARAEEQRAPPPVPRFEENRSSVHAPTPTPSAREDPVSNSSGDESVRIIELQAQIAESSLDTLRLLLEFIGNPAVYHSEYQRVGTSTVNPDTMTALRLCKSIGDHCAKYTDDRNRKEARQNFIKQIQAFVTKRTATIIDRAKTQGSKIRAYMENVDTLSGITSLSELRDLPDQTLNQEQVMVRPHLHWSSTLSASHRDMRGRGTREIYSNTGAIGRSHLLCSLKLVDAELDAWNARLLGKHRFRSHFLHRENVRLIRYYFGEIQAAREVVSPVFSFLACERDSMGNLGYSTHEFPDEPTDLLVPVDKFVLKVRAMLREFLRLMFERSHMTATLSSYCSEDLCAFTAEQLDIRYCHRMIQYVPVVIRSNLTMEAAQRQFNQRLDEWCDQVFARTVQQRDRLLAQRSSWAHLQAVTATALTDLAFFPWAEDMAPLGKDAAKRYNPELTMTVEQLRGTAPPVPASPASTVDTVMLAVVPNEHLVELADDEPEEGARQVEEVKMPPLEEGENNPMISGDEHEPQFTTPASVVEYADDDDDDDDDNHSVTSFCSASTVAPNTSPEQQRLKDKARKFFSRHSRRTQRPPSLRKKAIRLLNECIEERVVFKHRDVILFICEMAAAPDLANKYRAEVTRLD